MIEDNRGKVMLQEVEALELNKFMDIDLLDKKISQKFSTKKKNKDKIRSRARRIEKGKKTLEIFL